MKYQIVAKLEIVTVNVVNIGDVSVNFSEETKRYHCVVGQEKNMTTTNFDHNFCTKRNFTSFFLLFSKGIFRSR